MLRQLEIRNYAIIQHVQIDFDRGLNIITGETGAGKSILIGALGLSLGDRVDSKILYNAEEKCVVEASYDIKAYHLEDLFAQLDLDYEELTIIRREIRPNGKSRAFVNDTPVTLDVLKLLAEKLINLTSQNETQQLNKESYQIDLLDAAAENQQLLVAYRSKFLEHKNALKQLEALKAEQAKLQNDFDFFSFQLNEINEADFLEDDLSSLEEELNSLNNAETIKSRLFTLSNIIDNSDSSILGLLQDALSQIRDIQAYKKNYAELNDRLNSVLIEIEDIKNEADDLANLTEFDQERIETLNNKVNEANRLIRKHQVQSIEDLVAVQEELKAKTSSVHQNSKSIDTLQAKVEALDKERIALAKEISKSRKEAKSDVINEIQSTMQKVGMPNAVFEIHIEDKEQLGPKGIDKVVFKFNANKGFEAQNLNKVASGGELSRVLLSIQALLAKKTALPTLIFDEIDTGISGETAAKVAEVFRTVSKTHQLIAISHLPQIAAKAEKHFFIYKDEKSEKTATKIAALNEDQHIKAIARMLSGENISPESISNAKSLIN